MKPIISEKTRRQVSAAIKAAERDTSGEIVVVLAHRSDDYLHVPLHYAAAGALALPLILYLGGRELSVIKSFGTFGGEIEWRIWRIC
jgi:uncharacterized membrane protein